MRFLRDERLYWDAEYCLRFLRELETPNDDDVPANEPYHLYWQGPFSTKQAFAVKSVLATQRSRGEVCLWLDAEDGYPGHDRNEILRSLASEVSIRSFDPALECRGTPLEDRRELQENPDPLERANLFRLVTLYKHGGVYLDLDTMLLRDLGELLAQPFVTEDFCYRWSAHLPYANNAVLRFRRGSENARKLLERSVELGSCNPTEVLQFEGGEAIDLTVLPCAFFDPLWPHADGRCRFERAPFDDFEGFFRKFSWRFRPRQDVGSYREFFPGAFAYHWHNLWDAPEHDRSYFGRFARDVDAEISRREPLRSAAAAG
jgi:Glycosyltransferase sugar-binding region containing DXD motif